MKYATGLREFKIEAYVRSLRVTGIHKGTQTLSIVALSIVNFLAYYNMSLKNRSNEHRFFVNHPDG